MKNVLLAVGMVLFGVLPMALGGSEGSMDTPKVVRELSDVNDVDPNEAQAMFDDVKSYMKLIRSKTLPVGTVVVEFFGTGEVGSSGRYCVEFSKGPGSPVEYACQGIFYIGKTIKTTGQQWAWSVSIDYSAWLRTPWKVDGYHLTFDAGAIEYAGVGKVVIDSCEYDYIRIRMKKITCTSMGAMIHNFN